MKKLLTSIFLAIIISVLAGRMEISFADEPPTFDLGETVVTATKEATTAGEAPANISVITKNEIKSRHPLDTGELIRSLAGVNVLTSGSPGQLTTAQIRGSFSTQVLILLDGRPINIPSLGSADLSGIPVDIIERIEVVRGPYSSLYGANAMAGVINIITKKPEAKQYFKLDTSCGSFSTLKTGIEYSIPAGNSNILLLSSLINSEGTRQNSALRQQDINLSFNGPLGSGNLIFSGGWHKTKTGNPGVKPAMDFARRVLTQQIMGTDDISSPLDYTDDSQGYINLKFTQGNFTWHTYLSALQPVYHFQYLDGFGAMQIQDDFSRTGIVGTEVRNCFKHGKKSSLTVGAGWENTTFTYNTNLYNQGTNISQRNQWNAHRITKSYYLEEIFDTGKLLFSLGLRLDNPSDFPSQLSPRIALLWRINNDNRLRASYGQAYRAPTLNDLAWPEDPFSRGNPNLQPEKSTSYEIGIESNIGRSLLGRLTFFKENVKDMIAWAPTGPVGLFGNKWQPSNLNEMRKNGLEAEICWKPLEQFTVKGTYTYIDAVQTNNELVDAANNILQPVSRVAANIPRRKADLDLSYNGKEGFNIILHGGYSDEKYQYYQNWNNWPTITMDTKTIPSYTVFDIYLTKNVKIGKQDGNVFVNLYNIFNQEYALNFGNDTFDRNYPMPGSSIYAGFSVKF